MSYAVNSRWGKGNKEDPKSTAESLSDLCAPLSSSKKHWEELLLIKQRGSKNPWHNVCLQTTMTSQENEVRRSFQNQWMTTMAEMVSGSTLPAHWWQKLTKEQLQGLSPAGHCPSAPPSTPALSLPKKSSEFTALMKTAVCGSVAKNS